MLANRTIGLSREYIDAGGKLISSNVGLEKTYDSLLRGVIGKRLVRRIAGGAFVPVEGYEIEPENGKDEGPKRVKMIITLEKTQVNGLMGCVHLVISNMLHLSFIFDAESFHF